MVGSSGGREGHQDQMGRGCALRPERRGVGALTLRGHGIQVLVWHQGGYLCRCPPLGVMRAVASYAASQPTKFQYHIGIADVSVTFSHATMDEALVASPWPGCGTGCRRVRKALYGTRKAARLLSQFVRRFLLGRGLDRRSSRCGGVFSSVGLGFVRGRCG